MAKPNSKKMQRHSIYKPCHSYSNDAATARGRFYAKPIFRFASLCHIHYSVYCLGRFHAQTDHSTTSAPLTHCDFCVDDILDNSQVDSIFIGRMYVVDTVPLVSVLPAYAVDSASGGIHCVFIGKTR